MLLLEERQNRKGRKNALKNAVGLEKKIGDIFPVLEVPLCTLACKMLVFGTAEKKKETENLKWHFKMHEKITFD